MFMLSCSSAVAMMVDWLDLPIQVSLIQWNPRPLFWQHFQFPRKVVETASASIWNSTHLGRFYNSQRRTSTQSAAASWQKIEMEFILSIKDENKLFFNWLDMTSTLLHQLCQCLLHITFHFILQFHAERIDWSERKIQNMDILYCLLC